MEILIAVVLIIVIILAKIITSSSNTSAAPIFEKYKYSYQSKQWFMSKSEHDTFDALVQSIGNDYHIFPQVKLDKILDWKGNGKSTMYAMRHINQKSVDYLLCDKKYINPRLAIELDDSTHERNDRQERDAEVQAIFKEAKFPLLRITRSDIASIESLKQKVTSAIK